MEEKLNKMQMKENEIKRYNTVSRHQPQGRAVFTRIPSPYQADTPVPELRTEALSPYEPQPSVNTPLDNNDGISCLTPRSSYVCPCHQSKKEVEEEEESW